MANGHSKRLVQPIVIEARPGAGGNIGAAAVAKADPDGYTIGPATGAHAISGALYKSLGYDSVDSFEMIATVVYYALVIAVRSDYETKSLKDLMLSPNRSRMPSVSVPSGSAARTILPVNF
jgi:tripartite-type tricarboxylate transporter receptor subunit TctC